jgi:hypothetical protein
MPQGDDGSLEKLSITHSSRLLPRVAYWEMTTVCEQSLGRLLEKLFLKSQVSILNSITRATAL